MTEIRCIGCGKVILKKSEESWLRFRDRKFCSRDCSNAVKGERTRTKRHEARLAQIERQAQRFVFWPRVTGEIETSFHQHNHDPGDVYGHLPLRPVTLILRGSSADL